MRSKHHHTPPATPKMAPTPLSFEEALQRHQAGHLEEAETAYRQILAVQPDHPDALHAFGFLCHQRGEKEAAAEWIGKAVALRPNQPIFMNNLGIALQALGRLDEALDAYQKILALQPDNYMALCNLGNIRHEQGQREEAIHCYQKALVANPDLYEIHNNLGNALVGEGRLEEATESYHKALAIKPDFFTAYNGLGTVLRSQGNYDASIECYEKALAINPRFYEAHNNLGNAFLEQGNLDEAVARYRLTLEINPHYPNAYHNLGNALRNQGKTDEAILEYQKALEINPHLHEIHNSLGNALQVKNRLQEAIDCYQKSLALEPHNPMALSNLGTALQDLGRLDEAIVYHQQSLDLTPDDPHAHSDVLHQRLHICDWRDYRPRLDRMMTLFDAKEREISPFILLSLPTTPMQQKRCAEFYTRNKYPDQRHLCETRQYAPNPTRIKIAYLSGDYQNHPVAFLSAELFELHDRNRFEIFAYSYGRDDGREMRQRIMAASDHFIDLFDASHEEAAQRILDDGIHILVDLTGFTKGARLEIPALRPAPIQANWLGFAGTMGAPFIHYTISDPFITPPGYEPFFVEKILRLPECFQPNDRQRGIAEHTPTRQERGLPEKGIVFASFNKSYKINPELFDIWMRLLKQLPDSLLWLAASNRWVENNLRQEAEARGVDNARIFFVPRMPLADYLANYRLVDLVLDTYPYNSGTTASNGLWAGCPMVTCAGENFASRQAGSLLMHVGLSELVTYSLEAYESLTLELARDPARLAALRKRLQENLPTSPLFDSPRFTRHLEAGYEAMWQRFQSGLAPDHINVQPMETSDISPSNQGFAVKPDQKTKHVVPEKTTAPTKTTAPPSDAKTNRIRKGKGKGKGRNKGPTSNTAAARTAHAAVALKIQEALKHHNAGQLPEAEAIYRQILASHPNHPEAMHLLGFVFHQRGQQETAAEWIGKAVAADPKQPMFLNNLGIVLRDLGQREEAIRCYQKALAIQPDNQQALCNLGSDFHAQGQWTEAANYYRRVLAIKPDLFDVHNSLGNVLLAQGLPEEAIACYRHSVAIQPNYQNAYHNLGNALRDQGQMDEAIASFQKALAIQPDLTESHNSLGNTFQEAGRPEEAIACYQTVLTLNPNHYAAYSNQGQALQAMGRTDEAIECYHKSLAIEPRYFRAQNDMGVALMSQGRQQEAIDCYHKALALAPDAHGTYNNLGVALMKDGQWTEAITYYEKALAIAPNDCSTLNHLSFALQNVGQLEEAIACCQRALEVEPDNLQILAAILHQMQQACAWEGFQAYFDRMMTLLNTGRAEISPFILLSLPTTPEEQRRCAEVCITNRYPIQESLAASRHYDTHPDRIKIGYLSCDFQDHATAHLMAELFELHDHDRFEIKAYSYGQNDGGLMRPRLMEACDSFTDLLMVSHKEAAQCILEDGVHILVELKGHTKGTRMEITTFRPAPIQVSWVGYPGTVGADFLDYILTDPFVTPHGFESHFTEKVVRLPGCYQPNDRKRVISDQTPTRQSCGLPEEGFLFASLNSSYKISSELFDVWMGFLKAMPDSVLWLIQSNPSMADNLRREAEARGVEGSRLYFAPKLPVSEHLARYRIIDLALDTYPYTSHTTGSDALWAGCPLVACAGQTFASRVTGSLLTNVGLSELITDSLDGYADLAMALANDPERLAEIRQRLHDNLPTAPLFDSPNFTRNLESAYEAMWQRFQAGMAPDHIDVQPLEEVDPRFHHGTPLQGRATPQRAQPTALPPRKATPRKPPVPRLPVPPPVQSDSANAPTHRQEAPSATPVPQDISVNQVLLQYMPSSAGHYLEIGCGTGLLGEQTRQNNPEVVYHGVEINPESAGIAAARLDHVHGTDIESDDLTLPPETFDCILIRGGVTKQIHNPLKTFRKIRSWLKPGGYILCCLPNLQHHTVLASLLEDGYQHHTRGGMEKPSVQPPTCTDFIRQMLDTGFVPQRVSTVRSAPEPAFFDAIQPGMRHMQQDPQRGMEHLSILHHVFKGTRHPTETSTLAPPFPLSFVVSVQNKKTLEDNLLNSPVFQGNHPHQIILLEHQPSAAEALEKGVAQALHDHVVSVQPEVYLPHRWDAVFCQKIREAETLFDDIGIVGVHGATLRDGTLVHNGLVIDRRPPQSVEGPLPIQVESLDDMLFCFKRESFPGTDPHLGHHLYATDMACAYRAQGASAIVVEALCHHNIAPGREHTPEFQGAAHHLAASPWQRFFPMGTPLTILPPPLHTTAEFSEAPHATENLSSLLAQARTQRHEQRTKEAMALYERVLAIEPNHVDALHESALLLGTQERAEEGLKRLMRIREISPSTKNLEQDIQTLTVKSGDLYNACLQSRDAERAARIMEVLSTIHPTNPFIQDQALKIFSKLGQTEHAVLAAQRVLKQDPHHAAALQQMAAHCQQQKDAPGEIQHRVALAQLPPENHIHKAFHLQEIYAALSAILLTDLDAEKVAQVDTLVTLARTLASQHPLPREDQLYHSHIFYHAAIDALDIHAVTQPTPPADPWPPIRFAHANGDAMEPSTLRTKVEAHDAEVVFFVAADPVYLSRHAKRYVSSILQSCDVHCLILIHIIGGIQTLETFIADIGIEDARLVFSADDFDPETRKETAWKVQQKEPIRSHLVYYQSARFLWLDYILELCERPMLVTDIDQLLQRGVRDMLERLDGTDVVFHEATRNKNMADRLIANLLMVHPTEAGKQFTRFLRHYLGGALQRAEEKGACAYFLDQNALLMARHHLAWVTTPQIGYFEELDINVGMFQAYQRNPFRFFSFYTGFDMASLPDATQS